MKINLIDDNDAMAFIWILQGWVKNTEPPRHVAHQGQHVALTIGKLKHTKLSAIFLYCHSHIGLAAHTHTLETSERQDCFSSRLQAMVAEAWIVSSDFVFGVFEISEPNKESLEVCTTMVQCILVDFTNIMCKLLAHTHRYVKHCPVHIVKYRQRPIVNRLLAPEPLHPADMLIQSIQITFSQRVIVGAFLSICNDRPRHGPIIQNGSHFNTREVGPNANIINGNWARLLRATYDSPCQLRQTNSKSIQHSRLTNPIHPDEGGSTLGKVNRQFAYASEIGKSQLRDFHALFSLAAARTKMKS
ncbi:hypothetical protein PSPL106493_03840 [Pseudomonas plecoglossicida]